MDNLLQSKIGQYNKIIGFENTIPLKIKRRLLELGFTIGQNIKVVRTSFLKKAYLVEIRGYTLTIRKDIARYVLI